MADMVLHPRTEASITAFQARPSHAVLINGPSGIGKSNLARLLAGALLETDIAKLADQPYLRVLGDDDASSIPIEAIRELNTFVSRKVPGTGQRVIIIDHADRLTTEAQNALLKTLEEPPVATTLILTASSEQALLPTIRSRVSSLAVVRPSTDSLTKHFATLGFNDQQVQRATLMSGGLPGLMHALLHEDATHPLFDAVVTARDLVQKTTFERLALVDGLSKDKTYCLSVLTLLQQMAHVALLSGKQSASWQRIMTKSYEASKLLAESAQPKLVLTNLMLSI